MAGVSFIGACGIGRWRAAYGWLTTRTQKTTMARSRNIKPSIMDNEELAELEPLTRLLFVYLWMLADREGRLEDRPKRIAAQALPYDRAADVEAMLGDLEQAGFIVRYVARGVACIRVASFAKHQTPHGTERDSNLPDENGLLTVHERGKNGYATGSVQLVNRDLTVKEQNDNTLIPDSLIPDSLIVGKDADAPPARKKAKAAKTPIPEDFGVSERVKVWAERKGFTNLQEHLEAFVRKCKAKAYENVSWDDAFMEAIREDWAKLRGRSATGAAPPPNGAQADWAKAAGFDSVYEAENAGCRAHNAAKFRNGKKLEGAS